MNKIEDVIKTVFLMTEDTLMPITICDLTCYLAKDKVSYSVAIPCEYKKPISESFVGLEISTSFANFENKSIPVLVLEAPYTVDIDKLVLIASDFLNVDNRKDVLNDPYVWIDKWKEIFGDSIKKKMVFDVIGEMLALKTFYGIDKSLVWVGQEKGTHDIVGKDNIYEVKSTLQKTGNIVGVHSSYQLSTDKNTYFVFVRLEKKPHSILSINSLEKDLIKLGYDSADLEKSLELNGYKVGNRSRDETYDLLSLYIYDVNNQNFPIIGLDEINNYAPYKNIIGYEFKVDLQPLEKDILFQKK